MRISHLILRDFGKFENFECDFSPGLNVIKGPNEAGKSTIVDALTAALFSKPETADKHLNDIKRWGGEKGPTVEALVSVDGTPYKLTRDFQNGRSSLNGDTVNLPGGTQTVDDWIKKQIGITSEEIFKATACITQGKISHIEGSIEAIKDKLELLVTGSREDQAGSNVLKKIDERIVEITMEVSRMDSLMGEIDYNLNKLQRDMDNLRSKRADLIQVETAYQNVWDDYNGRKKRYSEAQQARQTFDKEKGLLSEYEACKKKIGDARELHKKIQEFKTQIASLKRISPSQLKEVEDTATSLNYYAHERQEYEREANEALDESKSYKIGIFGPALAILGLIGAALATAAHTIQYLPDFYPQLWYVLGGSVILLLIGSSVWNSRKQKAGIYARASEKAAEKLKVISQKLQEVEGAVGGLLRKYNVSSVEEMKRELWRYEELDKQYKEYSRKYTDIMAGQSLEALEAKYAELETEIRNLSEANKSLAGNLMDPAELEREKQVIAEFEERIKELERERKVLSQQIECAEGGSELQASYLERKDQITRRIQSSKEEGEILGITKECIDEARQNALKSKLEVLNGTTSDILNQLTSGRYTKVRFDKSNLKFEVWANEKQGWVDPETVLSSSTIDQIYLSARLALADIVSEHKNSIFIFDDPFSGYDDQRLDNVMKFLKNLSGKHQVLLMTSHDHYDRWADATVTL